MKTACGGLLVVTWLVAGCATNPVVLDTVGPRPGFASSPTGQGRLVVFTETEEYYLDADVPFFPHRDYRIYNSDGNFVRRVWNSQSHEDETPTDVSLAPGKYLVKADAEFYGPVTVPVVIEPGKTTRVVLQPGWKPSVSFQTNQLVRLGNDYFVGWRSTE